MTFLEALEWSFRHAFVYPLFRLLFRNKQVEGVLDISQVRNILILRYDRIGDMIVTTPIIRKLKRANPSIRIGVVTSPLNAEIIRWHPDVDRIHVLERNWLKLLREILRARRQRYDVVLNFIFNRTTSGALLANLIAPDGIKVGQGDEKYLFYFNKLLKLPRRSLHMVEILAFYLGEVFGLDLKKKERRFEIVIDAESHQKIDQFLRSKSLVRRNHTRGGGEPYVVFNLSATDQVRRLTYHQSLHLASFLSKKKNQSIVLIGAPTDGDLATRISKEVSHPRCLYFPEKGLATLRELASLIEGAQRVITPDTSIIHFAAAVQTPVLGFFTPLQDLGEWLPYAIPYSSVVAEAGCPVSSIPVETLQRRAGTFLSEHVPERSRKAVVRKRIPKSKKK